MANRPRYRLMIEGSPVEWVTDSSLEATVSDGRIRRVGLQYDGLVIEEHLDLRESVTNVSPITARISSQYADEVFAKRATYVAILDDDISATASTFQISDATGHIALNDIIHMGTEALKVNNVSSTWIGVTRQYWDTQAQGHYSLVDEKAEVVPVYDDVPSYEGRRCYLFEYDEGEESDELNLFDFSPINNGSQEDTADTVIWRGVISRPPRLDRDGITWLLDIEPITFLLEQELAKTEVSLHVKGVYHHAYSGCCIMCRDFDNSDLHTDDVVRGFYPTQEDFLLALNTKLNTLRTAAFSTDPQILSLDWTPENGYKLMMLTHASTPQEVDVTIVSPLLGVTGYKGDTRTWAKSGTDQEYDVGGGASLDTNTWYYKLIDTNVTEAVFGKPPPTHVNLGVGALKLPNLSFSPYGYRNVLPNMNGDRTIIGNPGAHIEGPVYKYGYGYSGDGVVDSGAIGSYPPLRLYLDRNPGPVLSTGSILGIKSTYNENELFVKFEVTGTGTDGTYGTFYVEVDSYDPNFQLCYPVTWESEITLIYDYGSDSNFGELAYNIVSAALEANKGGTPFIKFSDFSYYSVLSAWINHIQKWSFQFTTSQLILDLLKEHCKLYSWYMHLDSTGRIAFSRYILSTVSTAAIDATLDDTNIITPHGTSGKFPGWEPAIDGIVSVVEIARGYNPKEDSFPEGSKMVVRDVVSLSTHKNRSRGVVTIEPKGVFHGSGGGDLSDNESYVWAKRYLARHSKDYDVVELQVLSSVFSEVVCGSIVSVTSPHILNSDTGTRGIEDRLGMVIGRQRSLDPEKGATATLTIRLERELDQLYGYAPAMWVTDYTVASTYLFTCTVTDTFFAPTDYADSSFFELDDLIRIVEFSTDGTYPNQIAGTIKAIVSDTEVQISALSMPTSTSGYWMVEYHYDNGSLNDGQTDYCYIADSDGLLYDGSIGRRFA